MSPDFEDLATANREFVRKFEPEGLSGRAARGLAIVTCVDSRIAPLAIVGMKPGDAKILRNAGARVTEDVLRTLVLATYLLGVNRVLVMPHSDCRMASGSEPEIHQAIFEASGVDTRSIEIRTVNDQRAALELDLVRLRTYPLLPKTLEVAGAFYDVQSGKLEFI
ncbi:MAG: carbonic anhydrase [Actinobacteria bacterium]|uniref:Carbonic anhydrase n=1 Tax=Candidatus Fonsibacter lacus TaxID=2576439 RepID=A0A965GD84_9PROT|nr:carbonic anhydrase [Candidatus Fonsibacter lacus]